MSKAKERKEESRKDMVSIKIRILNGVNSTNIVSHSTLKIFEAKENRPHCPPIAVEGKELEVQFQNGSHYNFILEGTETLAASSIINLKISDERKEINIIQLNKKMNNRASSILQLSSFRAILDGEEIELKDGTALPTPLNAKIHASVFSKAGAIRDLHYGGFSSRLAFNATPSSLKIKKNQFLGGIDAEAFESREKDEGWQNNFVFSLANHPLGGMREVDFVLTCYDACGNRGEYHTLITTENSEYRKYPYNDVSIKDVECNIKYTYKDIHLYSLSQNIYYFPYFSFKVEGDYTQDILGAKLFRRRKNTGPFIQVAQVLYEGAKQGLHIITDTYGGINEELEYEYKIRALLKNNFYIDSQPINTKTVKPFELSLVAPNDLSTLSSAPDFSFSLSSHHASFKTLFEKENADYFLFGIRITSHNGKAVFFNTFRYWLDQAHNKDDALDIFIGGKFCSIKELGEKHAYKAHFEGKRASDFVSIDFEEGIVVIKKYSIYSTNMLGMPFQYEKNVPYYWDVCILDAKRNIPAPCAFYRERTSESGKIVLSSHCAISQSDGFSTNGEFTFNFEDGNWGSTTIPTSYIVKAKDSCSLDFLPALGAKIKDKIKLSSEDDTSYYCIEGEYGKDLIPLLLSKEGIIFAENDEKMEIIESDDSQDALIHPFSSMEIFSESNAPINDPLLKSCCYSLDIAKAYQAYNEFGFGEKNVLCGIIDTGINESHEDFYNIDGSSIIEKIDSSPLFDNSGHGSHCAGIIAAVGNNGKGIAGVSWKNTKLIPLKLPPSLTGVETYKEILKFVKYIQRMRDNGTLQQKTVPLNMSFGTKRPLSFALEVINKALSAGILPIAASGNSGSNLINYPAAYPGVLAVGSSDGTDVVSESSTRGHHISIVAPGSSIMSLGKDSVAHYTQNHGTSMAAPFVTGAVAYLMSFKADLTPFQIKTILQNSADKICGIEDFNTKRGFGRINVYEAAKIVHSNNLPENKFFNKKIEITAPTASLSYTIAIYSENNICVAISKTNRDGKMMLQGLLPGTYTAKLLSLTDTKAKLFVVPNNSNHDVIVQF